MNPYISSPIYVPEETSYFSVALMAHASSAASRLWCSAPTEPMPTLGGDPMVGSLDICVLGDGDEEVQPVEAVYLGISPDRFLSVVREDEQEIVFDFTWRQGTIEIDRAQETDEGFVVRKDDFGDDGIVCRLTPRKGNPFTLRLQIPYVGFSLLDADGNKLSGDLEIAHSDIHNYSYAFVGDHSNDRFQIALDEGKLNYMCVLNDDNRLSVRDMRNRMALVKEIDLQGSLSDLLMGAHSVLVKNKMMRWRIALTGDEVEGADAVELTGVALARFAFEQFSAEESVDEDMLAQRLMHMEQHLGFQWYWLGDADWSHENLDGLIDMDGLDADPEKMMRQALLFNRYEAFMQRLAAFSYISQKPIQGDQLQARNNKRKIARCVRHIQAHRAGEANIWELDDEARREIIHFHNTFHREFAAALEA